MVFLGWPVNPLPTIGKKLLASSGSRRMRVLVEGLSFVTATPLRTVHDIFPTFLPLLPPCERPIADRACLGWQLGF